MSLDYVHHYWLFLSISMLSCAAWGETNMIRTGLATKFSHYFAMISLGVAQIAKFYSQLLKPNNMRSVPGFEPMTFSVVLQLAQLDQLLSWFTCLSKADLSSFGPIWALSFVHLNVSQWTSEPQNRLFQQFFCLHGPSKMTPQVPPKQINLMKIIALSN